MDYETIKSDIAELLPPEQPSSVLGTTSAREEHLDKATDKIIQKEVSKEITRLKAQETRRLNAELSGVPLGRTARTHAIIQEQERKLEALDAIQAEIDRDPKTAIATVASKVAPYVPVQSTTSADVNRLLANIGVNLDVRLTKNDTSKLLATLLTCNEQQLSSIENNPKTPLVIKTLIRRLQKDALRGDTDTIEMLWSRIFGKAGFDEAGPANTPSAPTIDPSSGIPSTAISREAYILLRDTLIK